MATVGRGADQYTVRFPDGLRDRIKAAADANNRSMNAEIVATLEEKYPEPPSLLPKPVVTLLSDLIMAPDSVREQIYPLLRIELDKAGIPMTERLSEHTIAILLGYPEQARPMRSRRNQK